jgi:hypothetical protein
MFLCFRVIWKFCSLILLFYIFLLPSAWSQEMLGIINSNYSGINSLIINPANAGTFREHISINVLAGDVFINSNYFYIHKKDYGFLKVFKANISDPQYMYFYNYPEYDFIDTVQYYDYKKNASPKNLYFNGRLAGPSFMIRKGNHAFSFITGYRTNCSAVNIPYDVANFGFRGQDFAPQHNIKYDHGAFKFTALSWIEIGLGYTYTFFKDQNNEFNAGIVVKGLLGTGFAYGKIDNISYMVPNHDSIYFYKMNGILVLDLPMNLSDNSFSGLDPLVRGWGLSGDIGVTYTRKGNPVLGSYGKLQSSQNEDDDYLFKMGLSLIDAGKILFNKSVQFHQFQNVSNKLWSGLSNFYATSVEQFIRSSSYHLLGDSIASLTDKKTFDVFLPTGISLQGDYYFGRNLFLNATYVQGIPLGQASVRRSSLIALTPRYETPIFEINLPVSLLDFRDPAIGLALRIYSLIIGTEKLGTFLNLTDRRGMDLYFSLGINLNPKNKDWRYKKSKSVKCDSYEDYKRYQVR